MWDKIIYCAHPFSTKRGLETFFVLFPGAPMQSPAASGGGMTERDKVRMYLATILVGSGSSPN